MENLLPLLNGYYQRSEGLRQFLTTNVPRIASGISTEDLSKFNEYVLTLAMDLNQTHEKIQAITKLNREFSRYRYVQGMLEQMTAGLGPKSKYEAKNILERWLLNLANDEVRSSSSDPIFSTNKLQRDYPATLKMRSEMDEKAIPQEKIENVLRLELEYLNLKDTAGTNRTYPAVSSVRLNDKGVEVSGETFPIFGPRKDLLLSINPSVELLALMLVRYGCLLPSGQQWAIPKSVYQHLVSRYNVTVEGFASPVNSQIVSVRPDLRFCSLFPDTDVPYGSLGSFFDQSFEGQSVMANPPFVPAILESTVQHINRICSTATGPVRFFLWVPDWTDADWYQSLLDSRYRAFDMQLRRGSYHYTDIEGDKVPANFPSHVFILANHLQDDYRDFTKRLLDIYRST